MAAHEKPADPQPKKSLDAKLEEWPDERFWQEFNEFSIGTKWLETLKQVATRVIRPMYDRGLPPLRSSMASPYLYSTPIAEQTLREGPHMALGDGQLWKTPAAQRVRAVSS